MTPLCFVVVSQLHTDETADAGLFAPGLSQLRSKRATETRREIRRASDIGDQEQQVEIAEGQCSSGEKSTWAEEQQTCQIEGAAFAQPTVL